jgi:hypothetical protein
MQMSAPYTRENPLKENNDGSHEALMINSLIRPFSSTTSVHQSDRQQDR